MSEDLEDELGARSSMDRKMAELRGEVRPPAGPRVWGHPGGPASISHSLTEGQEPATALGAPVCKGWASVAHTLCVSNKPGLIIAAAAGLASWSQNNCWRRW